MGTSQFAVPALEKLIETSCEVVGVVTQPDRPKGRGKKVTPTPVKEFVQSINIPVYQPQNIKEPNAVDFITSWDPDLIIVVSYGQIIPSKILQLPPAGCINIHASLLPRYRGAAPIQRCLMNGDAKTGITTMFMDEGLDTGDILLQEEVAINDETTYGELHDLLAHTGANLIIATINKLKQGSLIRTKQNDKDSTYAEMIRKADELINWQDDAWKIYNQIRGLNPQPGAYTLLDNHTLKIFKARIVEEYQQGQPGEITSVLPEGFIVKAGSLALKILELQQEGKKRINTNEFLKGHSLKKGTLLGK